MDITQYGPYIMNNSTASLITKKLEGFKLSHTHKIIRQSSTRRLSNYLFYGKLQLHTQSIYNWRILFVNPPQKRRATYGFSRN